MALDKLFNLLGMIIILAIIATVLASKNTRADIAALGSAFTGAIRAATGR